ncbi:probable WRKY transcription factor 41 [Durio zibethinus]|uniref:Probable WRKY transcription factor 41 n=1 Tax=Durio zibethinus TaxID=66656 RepID=A0A6P5ZTF6_DURZI|nr:probable WRKY transcription factor 41 [Durio zibethinus]
MTQQYLRSLTKEGILVLLPHMECLPQDHWKIKTKEPLLYVPRIGKRFNAELQYSLVAKPQPSEQAIRMPESQPPRVGSTPRSEVHDCDFEEQELKDDSKKRKTLLRLAELIRVPSTSLEVSPDDGFSWRKYEQKENLGSKYPRSYYWCISGNAQGCLAQKQVQRSDDDPTIFEITYHGWHTCTLGSHVVPFLGPLENQDQETFYASPTISGITYCSTSPSPSPSGMNPIMQEDIDF